MRAIKIDSKNRTVTEIEITQRSKDDGCLDDIYKAIGCDTICQGFSYRNKQHICFVDDNGLIGIEYPKHFFAFRVKDNLGIYGTQPLAGNGVIVKVTPLGNSGTCGLKLEDVRQQVSFFSLEEVRQFIRAGIVDYNTYHAPLDKNYQTIESAREVLRVVDLGAFDKTNGGEK